MLKVFSCAVELLTTRAQSRMHDALVDFKQRSNMKPLSESMRCFLLVRAFAPERFR